MALIKEKEIDDKLLFSVMESSLLNITSNFFMRIDVDDVNKDTISKLIGINCALMQLRKLWMPSQMSSQNDINKENEILNEFYNNFLIERKKMVEEYED